MGKQRLEYVELDILRYKALWDICIDRIRQERSSNKTAEEDEFINEMIQDLETKLNALHEEQKQLEQRFNIHERE